MNLLFDLGGVITDIRRENCVHAFEELGLKDANSYFGDYAQTGIFMGVEDGSIDVHGFHKALHALLPQKVTDAQIDEAFQKFITGIPVHRLRALESLRAAGHRIYLLSNTNPIMWDGILAAEFRKDGHDRDYYFDGMVTSFEAKCAKPDPEIFRYTCRKLGIRPEETVFFDDSTANTDAAAALGFRTVHVPEGAEFMDLVPEE